MKDTNLGMDPGVREGLLKLRDEHKCDGVFIAGYKQRYIGGVVVYGHLVLDKKMRMFAEDRVIPTSFIQSETPLPQHGKMTLVVTENSRYLVSWK